MTRHALSIVLLVLMSGASGHAGDPLESPPVPGSFILSSLTALPAAPENSTAFVRIDIAKDGTQTLGIRVLGLPAGEYEAFRNGAPGGIFIGTIEVGSDGIGQLTPEPPEYGDFFEWFQYQSQVWVLQGLDVLFSDNLDPPGGELLLDDYNSCTNGVRLIAVADDLDARGEFTYRSGFGWMSLRVRLERLTPGPYVVEVAGQPHLLVDVGPDGKGELREHTPEKPGMGTVTVYDAVSSRVRVLDAWGTAVLDGQLPWDPYELESHPAKQQGFASLDMGATDGLRANFVEAGETSGLDKGWIAWQRDPLGSATVTVWVYGQDFIPQEPYAAFVGDTWLGDVDEYVWQDDALELSIPVGDDVDLRGQRIEVRSGDEVGLALIFPRSVPAALRSYRRDVRKPDKLRLDLLNPGTDLDATGRLSWRRKPSGAERLDVFVDDLPAGVYDLVLDGSAVAPGVVVIDEAGGSASVSFSSTGSPASALPPDFEVKGQLEIRPAGSTTPFLQQDLGG